LLIRHDRLLVAKSHEEDSYGVRTKMLKALCICRSNVTSSSSFSPSPLSSPPPPLSSPPPPFFFFVVRIFVSLMDFCQSAVFLTSFFQFLILHLLYISTQVHHLFFGCPLRRLPRGLLLNTSLVGRVAQSVQRLSYGLDGSGSNPGGDEIFGLSRPAVGPTQPHVQWVPGLSRG